MTGQTLGGPQVQPHVRVYGSTHSAIATGTVSFLEYDTELYDTDAQHFTSNANLTGTVSKTSGSQTLTGSGTSFTTELSVGQIISVPGTSAEERVVTDIASNTSLTVAGNFANTASGQTATRVNTGLVCRKPGLYLIQGLLWYPANATGSRGVGVNAYSGGSGTYAGASVDGGLTVPAVGGGESTTVSVTTLYRLGLWDYVKQFAFHTAGTNLTPTAGSHRTYFGMVRLSD